ncbi:MAG: DUF6159 family protein [Acidobacteriota bacterium]
MFQKLSDSWQLVKASAAVLRADKELVIFPLLSSVALVVTCAIFFAPLAFVGFSAQVSDTAHIVAYLASFFFYFVATFIMVFFNSALVGAALIRLEGGDPTVGDGLRIARQHLGAIFRWSLLAATVGMLLKAARERAGWLGSLVLGIIGLAWNLATFLVVPVLVTHNLGPVEALKKSASLLKKTWGEQIAGNLGLGAFFGVVGLGFTIIAVPLLFLALSTGNLWVIAPAVIVLVLGYGTIALLSTTLSGIYSAALYRFATTGDSGYMDRRLLANAFVPK